jgi:hypothetical protein
MTISSCGFLRGVLLFLGVILSCPVIPQRIEPEDLEYRGAFRLPDGPPNIGWEWNSWASALAFYPEGDSNGPDDGYPGSLFGVGHDHNQYVSEITIPVPVISSEKSVQDLNTAETLQDFQNISGDLFSDMEMPRVGLACLPPQGIQTTAKLYFAWAPHLDEGATNPSHGWCELDLSEPQPQGPWRIGNYWNYVTGDYMFEIPVEWASMHTPGMLLGTGRFRDGGQGALGPSLFAVAPWNEGNPPPSNSTIPAQPLILYDSVYEENPNAMD